MIGPISSDLLKIYNSLQESKELLIKYVYGITNGTDESLKNDSSLQKIKAFSNSKIDDCMNLLSMNIDLFENKEFLNILNNSVSALHSSVLQLNAYSHYEISKILDEILTFLESFRGIEIGIIALNNANRIINNDLKPKIEEVKEKVKDFDSLRLALEHRETSSIYLELHDKYKSEFDQNNKNFFNTLMTGVVVTLVSAFFTDNAFNKIISNQVNFWFLIITIKILIVTITITLCTLFLRRASHAKKLYEQAYQTHVEINAFPIHVRSLKDEDKHELIKELALKYFGKELDQTQNDKIGDLMKDQISAGTELIKASAEMVKSVKPTGASESG
ncbi:hypothetical protein AYK86_05655 [Acinetobacter venetianus]|nr:hypothetical protein AYK86_05655 [Acinetobacter venetianus]